MSEQDEPLPGKPLPNPGGQVALRCPHVTDNGELMVHRGRGLLPGHLVNLGHLVGLNVLTLIWIIGHLQSY